MIEKGQLIFFVYPCDSLSGVSFCSSFIGFYPLFSIFAKQQFFIVTKNCMCFVNHIEN